MKVVVQRVTEASVKVDNEVVGKCGEGMLLLVCCEKGDLKETVLKAAEKVAKLRIFSCPETGKMKADLNTIGGSILAVSQFTLSWDGSGGHRPGFDNSMEPGLAREYFDLFVEKLKEFHHVETGVFGAYMEVSLVNDGPVTFSLNF